MAESSSAIRRIPPVLRWFLAGCLIAFTGYVIYRVRTTLTLLFVSFFIAYLLDPVVDRLEARGIPRTLAIFIIIFLLVVFIVALFVYLVPQLKYQFEHVIDKFPNWSQWILDRVNPLLEKMELRIDRESLRDYGQKFLYWIRDNIPRLVRPVLDVFRNMFAGITNFIVGILNIVIIPVFAFYLLRDFDRISQGFYRIIPPNRRATVRWWMQAIDRAVGGFVRGQFTIASILAILYAAGLTIIGVPLGVLIGVISGLANMVPYMSLFVGLLPAMILSFVDEPSWLRLLWILAIFEAGQLLEGVFLGPRIMGKETGLHPVIVMVSIMFGGTLLGLFGIIIAVPVAAVLKVVVEYWHERWLQRIGEIPASAMNNGEVPEGTPPE